jgi:hypothetical protein
LSDEALHESEILVGVVFPAARLAGADGASVSGGGQALVDPFTDAFPERFPAASKASTASVYDVPQERPLKV